MPGLGRRRWRMSASSDSRSEGCVRGSRLRNARTPPIARGAVVTLALNRPTASLPGRVRSSGLAVRARRRIPLEFLMSDGIHVVTRQQGPCARRRSGGRQVRRGPTISPRRAIGDGSSAAGPRVRARGPQVNAAAGADHGAPVKPGGHERHDKSSDSGEHCGLRRSSAHVLKTPVKDRRFFNVGQRARSGLPRHSTPIHNA